MHCREEARYLLDESTTGAKSQFGTSKWNAATKGNVTLEITVSGPPIRLSHYALKSANDAPDRDPRAWSMIAKSPQGVAQVIHRISDSSRKWSGRWQWQEWAVKQESASSKFYLTIEGNHGDQHCTQLGQLRLFEWSGDGSKAAMKQPAPPAAVSSSVDAQAVKTLRGQFGLEEGMPAAKVVESAVEQLGLSDKVKGLPLDKQADECLAVLGVKASSSAASSSSAPVVKKEPEVKADTAAKPVEPASAAEKTPPSGPKFDPFTGKPIAPQPSGPKFDPFTGKPIAPQSSSSSSAAAGSSSSFVLDLNTAQPLPPSKPAAIREHPKLDKEQRKVVPTPRGKELSPEEIAAKKEQDEQESKVRTSVSEKITLEVEALNETFQRQITDAMTIRYALFNGVVFNFIIPALLLSPLILYSTLAAYYTYAVGFEGGVEFFALLYGHTYEWFLGKIDFTWPDLYFSLSWPTGDQIEELFAYIGMALVSVFSGWQNPLRHEDVERSLTVLMCLNLILALFKLLVTYATVFADHLHTLANLICFTDADDDTVKPEKIPFKVIAQGIYDPAKRKREKKEREAKFKQEQVKSNAIEQGGRDYLATIPGLHGRPALQLKDLGLDKTIKAQESTAERLEQLKDTVVATYEAAKIDQKTKDAFVPVVVDDKEDQRLNNEAAKVAYDNGIRHSQREARDEVRERCVRRQRRSTEGGHRISRIVSTARAMSRPQKIGQGISTLRFVTPTRRSEPSGRTTMRPMGRPRPMMLITSGWTSSRPRSIRRSATGRRMMSSTLCARIRWRERGRRTRRT